MIKHILTCITKDGRKIREITSDDYTAWTWTNDTMRRGCTQHTMADVETPEPDTLIRVPRK